MLSTLGTRSFSVAAPKLWNGLPVKLRQATSPVNLDLKLIFLRSIFIIYAGKGPIFLHDLQRGIGDPHDYMTSLVLGWSLTEMYNLTRFSAKSFSLSSFLLLLTHDIALSPLSSLSSAPRLFTLL